MVKLGAHPRGQKVRVGVYEKKFGIYPKDVVALGWWVGYGIYSPCR